MRQKGLDLGGGINGLPVHALLAEDAEVRFNQGADVRLVRIKAKVSGGSPRKTERGIDLF